jgi:hypothetical protein
MRYREMPAVDTPGGAMRSVIRAVVALAATATAVLLWQAAAAAATAVEYAVL